MAIYALKWAEAGGSGNVAYPDCAGDLVQNEYVVTRAEAPLKAATLAAGDIIDLGLIPGTMQVVDVTLVSDAMGAAALTFDIGVMSGTPGDTDPARTCGKEFFDASTIAQAGGVSRMSLKTGFRVAPVPADASIGLKIVGDPAGFNTTGKLSVIVTIKG
jgi:hypothetical protein